MGSEQRLRVVPKSRVDIPAPRGPLMRAEAIARDPELFNGIVSAKWVRENVPRKLKLGASTVAWYKDDVVAFLESRKSA